MRPEVVSDPEPDHQMSSAWRCYRACIDAAISSGKTHTLIVQDDAIVCTHFILGLKAAIRAQPDAIGVACVTGNAQRNCRKMAHAWEQGLSWSVLDQMEWCPTVATWYPLDVLVQLAAWADRPGSVKRAERGDDPVIGRFVKETKQLALATVPCLVEHPDDAPSLMGDRHWAGVARERISCCYIGPTRSALDVDWRKGP